MAEQVAGHFESLPRQAHAARLGMWIFLGTEVLLFAGLFVLYAAYRTEHPHGFAVGVENNTVVWGSVNTGVLLVSSYTIALAVHELRRGKQRACALLVATTIFLGMCFLAIKTGEYLEHFRVGLYPGGVGTFYRDHGEAGTKMFFTLYFCMTGLHAIHVVVGTAVLAFLLTKVLRRQIGERAPHPLAIGAIYWHLVDVIWIFLWPLFYLIPGSNP
jgi:cytochrome c oxidase subunit 3